MKIKSVIVVTEDDVRQEMPWDDFLYILARDINIMESKEWSKERIDELWERLGE